MTDEDKDQDKGGKEKEGGSDKEKKPAQKRALAFDPNKPFESLAAMGLEREHVLDVKAENGGHRVITAGGQQLRFPGDEERLANLSQAEKDGIPPKGAPTRAERAAE